MQFKEAMCDIKTWLFFALSFLINAPTGVFINVSDVPRSEATRSKLV